MVGGWHTCPTNRDGDEIYVQPYPGPGPEFTVSTAGGREPVWSPDGSELFYRTEDQLMVVAVEPGTRFAQTRLGRCSLTRTCAIPAPLLAHPTTTSCPMANASSCSVRTRKVEPMKSSQSSSSRTGSRSFASGWVIEAPDSLASRRRARRSDRRLETSTPGEQEGQPTPKRGCQLACFPVLRPWNNAGTLHLPR